MKFFFLTLSATCMYVTALACPGKIHMHESEALRCPAHSAILSCVPGEHENLLVPYSLECEVQTDLLNYPQAAPDNAMAVKPGLFGFFAGALKSVATWGGLRLTNWLVNKINRRASTYSRKFQEGDTGVMRAKCHWEDLIRRTPSCGSEPDHNLAKPGFQGAEECPICSGQLADLRHQ